MRTVQAIERGKAARPLGYITKPLKRPALQASIEIALHQNQEDLNARQREQLFFVHVGRRPHGYAFAAHRSSR